jgi:hypothetical protein
MPFTTFHFGPALLLKGAVPRRFSLLAFVASQVAIDFETLYWLRRGEWPVHRWVHTFLGSALVGAAVALITVAVVGPVLRRLFSEDHGLAAEVRAGPAVAGGLIGGLSHPLLDGIMHGDIMPFRPFSSRNPLLHTLDVRYLHILCLGAGVLGILLMIVPRVWKR